DAPDDTAVLVRQDKLDPSESQGLGGVNLPDARVRMRAAQYARVQHPWKMNVSGISGFPGHAFNCVNAGGGMADCLQRGEFGWPAHHAPPARAEAFAPRLPGAVERPAPRSDVFASLVEDAASTAST